MSKAVSKVSSKNIRRTIIVQSHRAHVGHIGSALCIAEILAVLYRDILNISHLSDSNRDRFILSKGHAALALYATLELKGWMLSNDLNTFCGNGTHVGVHPEFQVPGIDFSTGSLGLGLSFGVGSALAARLAGSIRRTFVLLSDAECNEGAIWEAAMFAAQHKLSNLTAIVDVNAQQALGFTKDILNLEPLAERWKAFGWDCQEVDGHNEDALRQILLSTNKEKPTVVLARTVFGKGVSFMESKVKWHYWPMSNDEYQIALNEIGN